MTSESALLFVYDAYLKLLHSKNKNGLWVKLFTQSLDYVCSHLHEYKDFTSIMQLKCPMLVVVIIERAS